MNRDRAEAAEASSSSKKDGKEGKKPPHVCGEINGVIGKGAFSKEGDKFRCVECGKVHTELPEGYMTALRKLSPKKAALLEKGLRNKTSGAEHAKWSAAGHKAWDTRLRNQAAAKKVAASAKAKM
jgi:hypothetical protein